MSREIPQHANIEIDSVRALWFTFPIQLQSLILYSLNHGLHRDYTEKQLTKQSSEGTLQIKY